MTTKDLTESLADIIITENQHDISQLKEKYDIFRIPKNTRQYEQEIAPDNSLDKFFYKYSRKSKLNINDQFTMMVWKFGNNYQDIRKILEQHGGKKQD